MHNLFQISESSNSVRRPVAYKKSVTSGRLPNISYDEPEFNGEGGREERRKKEVEDLISKYAKKKEKDEVIFCIYYKYTNARNSFPNLGKSRNERE